VLLHFEDFRINERLARFAVRHGMAGFVKSMIPAVERFVADRRLRCEPYAQDPASFGRRQVALLPGGGGAPSLARTASLGSQGSCGLSVCGSESVCSQEDSASDRSLGGMKRSGSMRRLGAMMLASGVAIAIARTASGGSLTPPPQAAHAHAGPSGRHSAGGKRHGGGSHSGSSHGSGHQRHSQGGSRHHGSHRGLHRSRSEMPPRPRRRQAEEEPQPAAVQA
jgi:hypothetical protein